MEVAELYRTWKPSLISLAYRMMGSMMDAEDIVQETFMAMDKVSPDQVNNPKAYLFKIVSNRCIDRLRGRSRHREQYAGPWLPEPILTDEEGQHDPTIAYERKETISMAFMLLIDQLSWTERVVFIMREVLQYEYDEIAEVVDKSSTNCRQIFRRAKRSLGETPNISVGMQPQATELTQRFAQALLSGNMKQLLETLTTESVLYMDGGGKVKAPLRPLFGHERIARFFMSIFPEFPAGVVYFAREINAQPGMVFQLGGDTLAAITLDIRNERIENIYSVLNPEKLTKLVSVNPPPS